VLDGPSCLLGTKAGYRRIIGEDIDERDRELLDVAHPEVKFAETTNADLGESPPCSEPSACAYAALYNPCTIIQFMVGSIEFLGIFCQVFKNFKSQFIYTEHVHTPFTNKRWLPW
jgi:hypothetical protein